ncbi:PRK06851 family protein [Thalassobacillus sp. CUG 92003]|uniref:PRK06851 family protein n=1 Tax=Thalassobacillus sp. CUG 92003 TaxID=2736641 RepID=UPI0015E7701E|nr:PRK06851 family protein [Thalassobacillus sp. CUG 92003]
MTSKAIHYFAGDHTAKGFFPLYDSNFQGMEYIIIMEGTVQSVKSTLLQKLADVWSKKNYALEYIHCSSDPHYIEGLIFPELKVGIFGGDYEDFTIDGATVHYMNTDEVFDHVNTQDAPLKKLKKHITETFESAHTAFKTGLELHDHLEDIYINNMYFDKANQATDELNSTLFDHIHPSGETAITKHRFFGASTPDGVIDYIPNLTEGLKKRYFIKGRAGTGKSTLLKKIAASAEELGYDTEIYHCGFDPESIDMVIVRSLEFCVFDSTDPHEYFPDRDGDEIFDLYKKAVRPRTDQKYANEIALLNKSYKSYMKQGIKHLNDAKQLKEKLEHYYKEALDLAKVDVLYDEITSELTAQSELADVSK